MQLKGTYTEIWRISYPIMLGSLAQTILNLTDTAFLARVGEVELGASAVAGVYYFVMVMAGMALAVGSQILIARKAGEGNKSAIGILFDHSLVILAAISAGMFLFMQIFSGLIFEKFLSSESIRKASITFIQYRSYGIFFILMSLAFRAFYTGIAQTRVITYSALVLTSVNIILAYAMILGHWGFEPLGIAGAGKASAIAECCSFIFLIVYTWARPYVKEFRLFKFEKMSAVIFKDVINISSPVLLQTMLSMVSWFLFFVFIEQMGEHELAISNVVRSSYMVLMTPMWGYSSATNSMVSNLLGQGKQEEVMSLIKKIVLLSAVTSLALFIINIFDYRALLEIITSDRKLIEDALPSYNIIWIAMFIFSSGIILLSAISGAGKTKVAMGIEFINIFIYMFYIYMCVFYIRTKLETVWLAEIIYWAIMCILSFWYLKKGKWKKTTLIQ